MAPALQQENAPTSSAPPSRLDEKLHQILYKPEARAKLVAFVADGNPSAPELIWRVREAVHAILTMPEYQLA